VLGVAPINMEAPWKIISIDECIFHYKGCFKQETKKLVVLYVKGKAQK
jgi:hypothetical protein